MLAFTCPDQTRRERIIGRFIRPVARELRSLELHLLVEQVSTGRLRNLESLVEASSELYFKPGTLRFQELADVDIRWGAFPKVGIVLTFSAHGIIAAFVLQLDTFSAGVELQYVSFPNGLSTQEQTELLERILKKSRRRSRADRGGARQPGRKVQSGRKVAQPPEVRPTQVFAGKLV